MGIKNLAFLKSMVRDAVAKEEQNKPLIRIVEEKQIIKPKNFLEIQRQKRKNKNKGDTSRIKEMQSTDITAEVIENIHNDDIGAIKANAQMLDDKIKRQQLRLRNVQDNNNETKAQVEVDYVNAIKQKIQILNQFK